jgi:hypothetical protein
MSIFGDIFDPFGLFRNDDTHARSIQMGMDAQLKSQQEYYKYQNAQQQAAWQAQQNSNFSQINKEWFDNINEAVKPKDYIDAEFEVVEVKLLENK